MDAIKCPHCNQAVETGEQEQGEHEKCPHCGELLSASREGALVADDSILQPEQASAKVLSEEDARNASHESEGSTWYKSLKETIYAVLIVLLLMCAVYGLAIVCLYVVTRFSPGLEQIKTLSIIGSLCAAIGIVAGHLTHFILRNASQFPAWKRFAAIFTPICYLILAFCLSLAYLNWTLVVARQPARRTGCQSNLRQIGLLLTVYYRENGSLPQLLSAGERLIYTFEPDYKEWIFCLGWTPHFCPYDKQGNKLFTNWAKEQEWNTVTQYELREIVQNSSYMYLGYVVTNDEEMRAFAEAYRERLAQGLPFDTDLEVPPGKGTDGGDKIVRLEKIGVEASSDEEREKFSKIPVAWDRCLLAPGQHEPTFFHQPKGINVLFLDGHLEFIRYGDNRWPLTEETMRLFWELENL